MKVLVTGSHGYIGRAVVNYIKKNIPSIEIIEVDLKIGTRFEELKNETYDAIIHLAALTAHSDIVNNKFRNLEINLRGTQNILDALKNSERARKFIYSSTGKVYGKIEQVPITEKSPTKPLNILGKSKLITEQLIDFYSDSYGVNIEQYRERHIYHSTPSL